jgi:hypothetical protein
MLIGCISTTAVAIVTGLIKKVCIGFSHAHMRVVTGNSGKV